MRNKFQIKPRYILVGLMLVLLLACSIGTLVGNGETLEDNPTQDLEIDGPQINEGIPLTGGTIDKWSLWNGGTKLRGANIYQRHVNPEIDHDFLGTGKLGPPFTQEDFDELAALGANYVNISHPGLYTEDPPYNLDTDSQNNLDIILTMVQKADMFAVISFRSGPGRSGFTFFWDEVGDWFDRSYLNDSMWADQAAQNGWVAMWRYTAQRYRDNPIVVGYDLMVEPNSNEVGSHALDDPLDIWDPEEFYDDYGGSLYDWNQLYPRITNAIREVDTKTPILIGGNGYSSMDWLPYLAPTGDTRTVYIAHQYAPHLYTHQDSDETMYTYPGVFDTDWDEVDDQINQAWLDDLLSTLDDFSTQHGVPTGVNEYGLARWAPGAADFIDDQLALFEELGINYAIWEWSTSYEPFASEIDAFNFQHGPDPENHSIVENDLEDTITGYWELNTLRPSNTITQSNTVNLPLVVTAPSGSSDLLELDQVKYWGYQIQAINEPGSVDALVATRYDMLVLEPTRTDWTSVDKDFDTKGMVDRLKNTMGSDGTHRKLVIAYIDIGEAEDWRWYWTWSTGWDCTTPRPAGWPDFIITCDPDGWGGNYPVAYWDTKWKDIVIYGQGTGSHKDRNYNSIIDEVIVDGFDGIYLDWVEAFENEDVIKRAQDQGLDPAVEMIKFIQEMKDYAALRNPDFVIIQQNAAALIDGHPELANVIDAIAQEAIWYDGDATDDWNDPNGHDFKNDASLINYYLAYLKDYQNAGLPVFDCEYALTYATQAYNNAYANGFIPYVTRRSLSKLTTTPPPGY